MRTEARDALIKALPEAEYNLAVFDKHVAKHGPANFMVLKVGGGILDRPKLLEACVGSIAHLGKLGFTPLVVHGGGPQINDRLDQAGIKKHFEDGLRVTSLEAMGEIALTLDEINRQFVDELEKAGSYAKGFPRAFEATYLNRPKYGEVGVVSNFDAQAILEAFEDGRIPVVSCLGRLASGESFLNINADDAAAEVARALHPLKYVALSPPGGVLDSNGEIISVITPELAKDLAARNVLSKGMLKKVREGLNLVEGGVASDVVIVHPKNLIEELFTHEGKGTLITRDAYLESSEGFEGLDKDKLVMLIQLAFGHPLDENYFKLVEREVAKVIITAQRYDGVGIFLEPSDPALRQWGVLYMDKLAVAPAVQGRGIGESIIEKVGDSGLFWRALKGHDNNDFYFRMSDDSTPARGKDGQDWIVFWRNVPDEIIPRLLEYAQQRPVTIHRTHGMSNS